MPQAEQNVTLDNTLQCSNCGATLHFAPGTNQLKCTYCGTTNEIAVIETSPIVSFDFDAFISGDQGGPASQTASIVSCKNCGASTTLPPEINSDNCAFCASPLVLSEAQDRQIIKPHYVLPFIVTQTQAVTDFRTWLKKLWFAPNDLPKLVSGDARQFKGVYIPHWSYDADTETDYSGMRGDYYYTTETYTEMVDGEEVTRTREVRHTQWWPVSGVVNNEFNDILISASNSLPQSVANRLEPWRLEDLVHYNEQYVSGFRSELFQIDAKQGLDTAKQRMQPIIHSTVLQNIGGDEQVVNSTQTTYDNVGLKYILLPAWISAYNYNKKLYHFTVNACTGEVVGERPYSAAKIALAVIVGIIIIILIIMAVNSNH